MRTRTFVTAGPHDVTVAFLERSAAETHEPLELHTRNLDLQDMNGLPVVDYVNLRGPFNAVGPGNTPSRERIFTCRPADESTARVCATEILSTLARRAYRRQPTEQDLRQLLEFYESGAARGGFDAGIESALRVMLTSPKFLFRDEPDPEGVAPGSLYAVDDAALASRLAFFLWSAPPDDAAARACRSKASSASQTFSTSRSTRMLADSRATALVENFAGQWLFLRNLQSARPDMEEFPDFDDNLRQAMRRETELLFEHVMREDRSVIELLTADYTFVNERLAKHYGIDSVYGSHFRKVPVTDPARRGLLGHASILTVTSYPNRTSPVLRGKWVLENVLGAPPPPPLPNVPALEENEAGSVARTLRERLAEHRANPVCATCHDVMDPIGLGLENFDAVGKWRTREPGGEIDAHGQLADGTAIDGAAALRERRDARSRAVRARVHGEAADVRARPRARGLRHADGAAHRARGRGRRLSFLGAREGRREQRAVPDAPRAVARRAVRDRRPRRIAAEPTAHATLTDHCDDQRQPDDRGIEARAPRFDIAPVEEPRQPRATAGIELRKARDAGFDAPARRVRAAIPTKARDVGCRQRPRTHEAHFAT